MLLFRGYHIKPISDGIKTETRRIWKKSKVKVYSIQLAKTKMLSKEYFAKLHILGVCQQKLGEMTEEDAKNEGGYTLEEYKKVWEEINGEWNNEQKVFVVKFERR